jgi:hypothetical protein
MTTAVAILKFALDINVLLRMLSAVELLATHSFLKEKVFLPTKLANIVIN